MNIIETLNKLSENSRKKPAYIYQDETDGQIKETPLLDSAASAYINRTMNSKNLKLIHDSIFGI